MWIFIRNPNYWDVLCESEGFPGGSDGKEFTCRAGDLGSIPGLGRSPGGRHGNLLQYSCLRIPMDRGTWRATVHAVAKSQTRLSDKALWRWKLLNCVRLFATPWLYSPWNSPGQNTRLGSHSLLQGVFPAQGLNPGLLRCKHNVGLH